MNISSLLRNVSQNADNYEHKRTRKLGVDLLLQHQKGIFNNFRKSSILELAIRTHKFSSMRAKSLVLLYLIILNLNSFLGCSNTSFDNMQKAVQKLFRVLIKGGDILRGEGKRSENQILHNNLFMSLENWIEFVHL